MDCDQRLDINTSKLSVIRQVCIEVVTQKVMGRPVGSETNGYGPEVVKSQTGLG